MKIIGIDPGIALVGFGVLEYSNNQMNAEDYGFIETTIDISEEKRLQLIYENCKELFKIHNPDLLSIEKLFFNKNVTTAFRVAQARGVILLAAQKYGIPVCEFTPLQVKMAVTGYGKATKLQIQKMVKSLLKLKTIPKPDDVADALAIAICGINSSSGLII